MSMQTSFTAESHKVSFLAAEKTELTLKKGAGGSDGFHQVFSDMQRAEKMQPLADARKDDSRPATDAVKPKADRKDAMDKAIRKDDSRHDDDRDVKAARDDHDDDTRAPAADADSRPNDKADDDNKNDDKPAEAAADAAKPEANDKDAAKTDDAAKTVTQESADTTAPETDAAGDFADAVDAAAAAQAEDATPQDAKTPAAQPAAAHAAAPQQALPAATENQKTDDASQEQAAGQEAAQPKILNFRPDSAAGHAEAGKGNAADSKDSAAPAPVAGQAVAAETAAATDKPEAKKDHDPLASFKTAHTAAKPDTTATDTRNGADTASEQQADSDTDRQLTQMARDAAQDKRALRKEAGQADVALQTDPSLSHPAAGARATAPTGFSAPPSSNGPSGGGTLPSAAAAKADAVTPQVIAVDGVRAAASHETTGVATLVRARESMPGSAMQPSEQVAVQLHRAAKAGTDRFDMQLHPADLGRVDVRLEISKDGVVQVTVTADNQAAYDMLQKDQRGLERALQQAGLQTDSNSLTFNLRGGETDGRQQQARNGQGGSGRSGQDGLPQAANDDQAAPAAIYTTGAGRVDVRV